MEISNGHKQMAAVSANSENIMYEEGQSSESVTNVSYSAGHPQDNDITSDTFLKLGSV